MTTVVLLHVRHRVGTRTDWSDERLRYTVCGLLFAIGDASKVHEPAERQCAQCNEAQA